MRSAGMGLYEPSNVISGGPSTSVGLSSINGYDCIGARGGGAFAEVTAAGSGAAAGTGKALASGSSSIVSVPCRAITAGLGAPTIGLVGTGITGFAGACACVARARDLTEGG